MMFDVVATPSIDIQVAPEDASIMIFRKIVQFKNSLLYFLFYFIALLWPFLIVISNPAPDEKDLISEKVRIIRASNAHPNLVAIIENGSKATFEFPTPVYDFIRGFAAPSIGKNYINEFNRGCAAKIKTQEMRFIPFAAVTRVWQIECGSASVSYEEMNNSYNRNLHSAYFLAVLFHSFALAVCGLIIYSDWGKK